MVRRIGRKTVPRTARERVAPHEFERFIGIPRRDKAAKLALVTKVGISEKGTANHRRRGNGTRCQREGTAQGTAEGHNLPKYICRGPEACERGLFNAS